MGTIMNVSFYSFSTNDTIENQTTYLPGVNHAIPRSGYDLPVYGLSSGEFLEFHITALTCIGISALSALTVICVSFTRRRCKSFFKWTRGERFVIYLSVCDGLFNIAHSLDHTHYLTSKDHVRPAWLCQMYGFILIEFVMAQSLMVNVIAFSAFVMMNFNKQFNFGCRDWRLLMYTFGTPLLAAMVAVLTEQLGPSGAFCYFDAVKGYLANIFYTTVPLLVVTLVNIVLYGLTWRAIRKQAKIIHDGLGTGATTAHSSAHAAKTMLLFVAAYLIQWWALAVWGVWSLADQSRKPPNFLFKLVTTFTNLGGLLNGIVYILIRYRMRKDIHHRASAFCHSDSGRTTINSPMIHRGTRMSTRL